MRLLELDLFRFIAAMGVVLFHYVAWYVVNKPADSAVLEGAYHVAKYGFLGVPLFFMISGFVILASAFNRNNIQFGVARFVRLYPIYWVCVALTALSVFIFGDDAKAVELKDFLINLTMLQSFVGVSNIDGVYWTLAKELQFYFCIFLLISFGVIRNTKTWVLIWFVATVTFTLFKQPFFMGWFISPEYSAFFIAGVCSYMMLQKQDMYFFSTLFVLSFPLAAVNTFSTAPGFLVEPSATELYIAIGIILVFYIAFWLLTTGKLKFHEKRHSLFISLGALTYPLYLIHNRLGKIMLDGLSPYIGEVGAILLTTVIMLIASYLLVEYFEKRVTKHLKTFLLAQTKRLQFLTLFSEKRLKE